MTSFDVASLFSNVFVDAPINQILDFEKLGKTQEWKFHRIW